MQPEHRKQNDDTGSDKKALNSYIRYSGMGFQMIAVIGICTYIGYKIDEHRQSVQLVFSAVFGLLGVCIALYLVISNLKKNQS